jgi:pyridoxamine---pyruvate transaminase
VRTRGLRLWAADESICADTVTAVAMSAGVSEAEVRAVARSESGVMLAGGQGGLPVLQIGHMGPAAYPLAPVIAVVALGRAGAAADVGAAVEAVPGEDSYRGAIKPECRPERRPGAESAAGP